MWEAPSTWPFCILSCSYISNSPFLPCLLVILLFHRGNKQTEGDSRLFHTLYSAASVLFSATLNILDICLVSPMKWSCHPVTFFLPSTTAFNLQHPLIFSSYAVFIILLLLPWTQLNQPHVLTAHNVYISAI